MKYLALTATAMAIAISAPAVAQTYSGGTATFDGVGDEVGSQFDIVDFTPISGVITGPGTYDINNVAFTVGINANTGGPFSGTFGLTGLLNGAPVNYNVAYSGVIAETDSISIGGNYINIMGQGVHLGTVSFSGVGVDQTVTGILTATVGGVPEPATWALMIMGFGAVGGAMRRRGAVRTSVRYA